jgi:hypothetical protein
MALKKTFQQLCDDAKTRISEISPEDLNQKLQDDMSDWVLIDVRENDEFRAGHLPNARGIGRGVLEYHIADEGRSAGHRDGNRTVLPRRKPIRPGGGFAASHGIYQGSFAYWRIPNLD